VLRPRSHAAQLSQPPVTWCGAGRRWRFRRRRGPPAARPRRVRRT
jgi:hypothetical protein